MAVTEHMSQHPFVTYNQFGVHGACHALAWEVHVRPQAHARVRTRLLQEDEDALVHVMQEEARILQGTHGFRVPL